MDNRRQEMASDKDMKNWVLKRKFSDFCNENDICSVLLVADNPFIEQYFKLLFSGCNCKFTSVRNGDDAIKKIEASGGADIVMVDNDIPKVNSAGLRKAIKKTWPKLKVIDVKSPAIGSGGPKSASSYIEKPFSMNSVVKTITNTIGS